MRLFEKSDLITVNDWLRERDHKHTLLMEDLPELGFIEPEIAVGFLAQAECKTCFLEGFVTNPKILKELRFDAVAKIIEALLKQAKRLNFKRVIGLTHNESLIRHAYNQGFEFRQAATLMKGIT